MPRKPRLTRPEKRLRRQMTEMFLRIALGPLDLGPADYHRFAEACADRDAWLEAYLTLMIGFERFVFGAEPEIPRPPNPRLTDEVSRVLAVTRPTPPAPP